MFIILLLVLLVCIPQSYTAQQHVALQNSAVQTQFTFSRFIYVGPDGWPRVKHLLNNNLTGEQVTSSTLFKKQKKDDGTLTTQTLGLYFYRISPTNKKTRLGRDKMQLIFHTARKKFLGIEARMQNYPTQEELALLGDTVYHFDLDGGEQLRIIPSKTTTNPESTTRNLL